MRLTLQYDRSVAFVFPRSRVFRALAKIAPKTGAFVWFNQVHLKRSIIDTLEAAGNTPDIRLRFSSLLTHELCHIQQMRRIGRVKFYLVWLWQVLSGLRTHGWSIRKAYKNAPLELEADEYARRHAQAFANSALDDLAWQELARRGLSR